MPQFDIRKKEAAARVVFMRFAFTASYSPFRDANQQQKRVRDKLQLFKS